MKYKAILFDLDNTLGDRSRSAYYTYRNMLLECTDITDEIKLDLIVQDCLNYEQFGTYDKNFAIKNINETYDLHLDFEDFNTYWDNHCANDYVLFEDTIDTVTYLKNKGYLLGIVSNGNNYGQWSKIKKTGLDKYMDTILVSSDIDIKKPDPRIYYEALNRLHVTNDEAVFVGDTFNTDIIGAINAGIRPIIIWNDKGRVFTDSITRIYNISDLKQLF